MVDSVNQKLLHESIVHAIALQRYSNGVVRRIIATLNRSASEIGVQLSAALARLPVESFTVQRLDSVLSSIGKLNAEAYQKLSDALSGEMHKLVDYELGYQRDLFTSVLPSKIVVEIPLASISAEQVYAAAMARPFQGALLREWASRQEVVAMQRLRDVVRSGYVEQATIQSIVSKVRGTRTMKFEDGVMAIDRRSAEALVRTAISHTAGFARDTFMQENSDIVKQAEWVSTLDGRTSEPCILRDRKLYDNKTHKPIGHTYPWGAGPGRFHWNCRSTSVPVVKSFRELGINIDEVAASTRASMDGQVAGDISYGQWLAKQSAAVQDDVLGATRGKLFRQGDLDISQFANDKGRWLSLDELRAKDAEVFAAAGL